MFCKHCGKELPDTASHCSNCGMATGKEVQGAHYAAPEAPSTVVVREVPEENYPLSPWAYFGLQILFAIPIVGFIFLIIFSCNGSNINRRNFARSYWCSLIIVGAILLILAMAGGLGSLRYY